MEKIIFITKNMNSPKKKTYLEENVFIQMSK